MKFRPVFASLLMAAVTTIGMTANAEELGVAIIGADGIISELTFPEINKIAVGDNQVTVYTVSGNETSIEMSDIEKINIGVQVSGIKDLVSDGSVAVWPTVVSDVLHVSGAAEGAEVSVYSLSGNLVKRGKSSEEVLNLDLSDLQSGAYVVNVSGKSVKIIKK